MRSMDLLGGTTAEISSQCIYVNVDCSYKTIEEFRKILTVQPPQSYSVGGQRSSGQLTGKPAGALPDYRGRWCAVSRGHPA
ncbi:UNVERIFIED_CONTAM: hypothetical protein FKN15_026370 [Acipenser sinensis]